MDYLNLHKELNDISSYSKNSISAVEKFIETLKNILKQNQATAKKNIKTLEDFISDVFKDEKILEISQPIIFFANSYIEFLLNFVQAEEKITNEITTPLSNFCDTISTGTAKTLKKFEKMINHLDELKAKLEDVKHKYYDNSKEVVNQQEALIHFIEAENIEEITKRQNSLHKKRIQNENHTKDFKDKVEAINKYQEEMEQDYVEIKGILLANEEAKYNFVPGCLDKLVDRFEELKKNNFDDFIKKVKDKNKQVNKDINKFLRDYTRKFNYNVSDKARLTRESFLDYSDYNEDKLLISNTANQLASKAINLVDPSEKKDSINHLSVTLYQDEECEIGMENTETKVFLSQLINSEEFILPEQVEKITSQINKKPTEACTEFVLSLSKFYIKNVFVKFANIKNLHHLGDIIILILKHTKKKKELNYLNYIILSLSEKTIFINPKNFYFKCYLCKIISKETTVFNKNYWVELIQTEIASVLDRKINEEIEKKNENSKSKTDVVSKFKNLFNTKISQNKEIENKMLYTQLYKEYQIKVASEIIENYIHHFYYFEYSTEGIEIITELSNFYTFSSENMNYFLNKINSNLFSTKYKIDDLVNIEELDYNSLYFDNINITLRDKYNEKDRTVIVIANSLKFLSTQDFPNVILLNKNFYSKLRNIIYKNVLLKFHDVSVQTRLKIWGVVLNIKAIKAEHDYKELLKRIEDTSREKEIKKSRDIIELDVMRTMFDKDVELNRIKLKNILIACSLEGVSYSQGMSYIAATLLSLTQSEEETFYIFLALIFNTDYGKLLENDLENLKKYFYVFERLLVLFMPEFYEYLKGNNINVSYFISPWFITLFTNSFNYNEDKENPKVLLNIWDMFLFNGWNSILKIGLSLLKHFEKEILEMEFERLLHFLLNDIVKSSFFRKDQFKTLILLDRNIKIERGLISNIENEYVMKKALKI